MTTRRQFLEYTGAGGVLAATTLQAGCGRVAKPALNASGKRTTPRIKSIVRREETLLRLGGDGDNFHMSWSADDRQLVAVCDGAGWADNPKGVYNSRLFSIGGTPQNARFEEIATYPEFSIWNVVRHSAASYYGFGTLALDGHIYQFLSTTKKDSNGLRFAGAKLIYSPDNGRTWHNQNGSTPVVCESGAARSRQNLVFFEEPQEAFSLLSVLQMGRNYELNQDGYVYVYAPNGNTDGTMNELVMFRMPKVRILDRSAYEFFAGLSTDGRADWTTNIASRATVHTFPRGWVNKTLHPYAWHPSVTYNAPLGLYMMANWGMGSGPDPAAPGGDWFHKPSYLGFWVAEHPWGPWTQVHEETAWMPGNDPAARAYQPQIAPKWISPDGKSFWLVWTDFQHTSEFWPMVKAAFASQRHEDFMRLIVESRRYRPYYAFNVQRVDLVIA